MSLLDIKDVDISYGKNLTVKKVNMSLEKGEICSIVGESGSGKTTVIRAAMGLLPGGGRVSAGSITYDGMDLLGLTHEQWRELRGHDISMIFQDSGAMMNQTRLIGDSYVEYIRTHEDISKEDAWAKGVEMIERMRLPDGDRIMRSYPFQLSGGQRQRVGIA
ncbi:MAG: ABC transporter ATP-binding protein, partial [Schwartzia sp.]|nr:ABC transporter ATP-binding protein [Schwartzia sp. (in: firmicutes)]